MSAAQTRRAILTLLRTVADMSHVGDCARTHESSLPDGSFQIAVTGASLRGMGGPNSGHIDVCVHEGGILERLGQGYITHAVLASARVLCDEVLERDATIRLLLTDMLDVEGFEPGVPIASLRWVQVHGHRWTRAAAVVGKSAMTGLAQSFTAILPNVAHLVTSSREDARRFLLAGADRSGTQRLATPARGQSAIGGPRSLR